MRTIVLRVVRCLTLMVAASALLWPPAPARAESVLVGIVIDYQPRTRIAGKSAISIKRDGEVYPVREHEIIYEGDHIVFEPGAGPKAFVKTMIATHKEVILDPAHPALPEHSPSFLQSLVPKLLAAYRWINSASESDDAEPRNALSRANDNEPDSLSVLPNSHGPFRISDRGADPLWIAWNGGVPPFKVSLSGPGKPPLKAIVCADGAEGTCVREATFQDIGEGSEPLSLTVESADGSSWSQELSRRPITWNGDLADATALGELGAFLRATDLLDRKDGYVLESARELASISRDYPPARTLLGRIRDGKVH